MEIFPTPSEELSSWMVGVLFYSFKIIGLAPLSIQFKMRSGNSYATSIKVFRFSKMGLLYNLVLAILISIMSVIIIQLSANSEEFPQESTIAIKAFDLTERILHFSTSSFIVFYFVFRQKKSAIIINRLLDVHFLLSGAKEKLSNKRSHILLSVQVVFHVFLWALTVSTSFVAFDSYLSIVADAVNHVIIYCLFVEYSLILRFVVRELEVLNKNLSSLKDSPNNSFRISLGNQYLAILSSRTDSQLATLKLLHSIRATLFELSHDIGDFFSLPILFSIVCVFLGLLNTVHSLITPILIPTTKVPTIIRINTVLWILITISPLMLLAYNVTATAKRAKLTGRMVHELLATARNEKVTAELEQFSLYLLHHEDVSFTAYGFFKLDFTLLQSIVGATATYLVIIIQFLRSNIYED